MAAIKRVSVSEQVRKSILKHIQENNLKPGDRMPTEKELADLFGVSRTSIREAMKSLSLNGALKAIQGKGTFVMPLAATLMNDSEFIPSDPLKEAAETRISDLTEIRIPLEETAVRLAVRRATPEEIAELKEISRQYELAVEQNLPTVEQGEKVHRQIAKMSKNPLLIDSIDFLLKKMNNFRGILAESRLQIEYCCRSHEILWKSIESGDEQTAVEEIRKHLSIGQDSLKELLNVENAARFLQD